MTSFTTQQIHDAIYRAAARIEREPSSYRFMSTTVPSCGTTGCMWGWIGFELGVEAGSPISDARLACGAGLLENKLYEFCREISCRFNLDTEYPTEAYKHAVAGMRAFADAHFPVSKAISTWVRQPLVDWRDCHWRPSTVTPATPTATPTPNRERV